MIKESIDSAQTYPRQEGTGQREPWAGALPGKTTLHFICFSTCGLIRARWAPTTAGQRGLWNPGRCTPGQCPPCALLRVCAKPYNGTKHQGHVILAQTSAKDNPRTAKTLPIPDCHFSRQRVGNILGGRTH